MHWNSVSAEYWLVILLAEIFHHPQGGRWTSVRQFFNLALVLSYATNTVRCAELINVTPDDLSSR